MRLETAAAGFSREDSPLGVSIRVHVNEAVFGLKGPWVDSALVGVLPTVGQTIEDAGGQPIRVDTDLLGQKRAAPVVGPLANLSPGENTLLWPVKKQ